MSRRLRFGLARLLAQLLILLFKESHQFAFDGSRVLTLENSKRAFEHHLFNDHYLAMLEFELVGGWNQEDVGAGDAVNGRNERDRNARANLIDVVEMLHDLNQAENSAY